VFAKVPKVQLRHSPAPEFSLALPTAHAAQTVEPGLANLPAEQMEQAVNPVPSAMLPLSQVRHSLAP
jgi:hypothetical protein